MNKLHEWMQERIMRAGEKAALLSAGRLGMRYNGLRLVGLETVGGLLGGEDAPVVGVGMSLLCEPPMHFLMLMTPQGRASVVHAVAGSGACADEELAASVLQEMGNILGSNVANSLAALLERMVHTSTPEVVSDLAGAILSGIIAGMESVGDQVLLVDVALTADKEMVDCRVFLFLDETLYETLLPRLGNDTDTAAGPDTREAYPGRCCI